MTDFVTIEFERVGPYAKEPVRIEHKTQTYTILDGKITLRIRPEDEWSLSDKFAAYSLFPKGSEVLKEAKEYYGVSSGNEASPSEVQGSQTEVSSDANGTGDKSVSEEGTNGGGGDDKSGQANAEPADNQGSEGNGGEFVSPNPKLQEAILQLNPALDKHWTNSGKPAMSAVEEIYGSSDITRRNVNEALPGWDREKAKERAGE